MAQLLAYTVAKQMGPEQRSNFTPDEQLLEEYAVYEGHRARGT